MILLMCLCGMHAIVYAGNRAYGSVMILEMADGMGPAADSTGKDVHDPELLGKGLTWVVLHNGSVTLANGSKHRSALVNVRTGQYKHTLRREGCRQQIGCDQSLMLECTCEVWVLTKASGNQPDMPGTQACRDICGSKSTS